MSLLSLRKHNLQSETVKHLRHKTRQVDAEQFIDQATSYANGQTDNVIAFQSGNLDSIEQSGLAQHNSNLAEHLALDTATETKRQIQSETQPKPQLLNKHADNEKIPFRRATFTLSEQCINTLNTQAKKRQCAKSHLVRMLIRHFDELPANEQAVILTQQKD